LTALQTHASPLRHMSVYSISRYLFAQPKPPFSLGGWITRDGEQIFLHDAHTRVELIGTKGLFNALSTADLVEVQVRAVHVGSIDCDKVTTLVRAPQKTTPPNHSAHATEFARFVRTLREFFVQRGFEEVLTPALVTCPGLEPHLEPFAVTVSKGREKRTAYLPTSPEIHLKKAMATGRSDIFEIKPCFRSREFSQHHENEFYMLEWYRGFADLALIEDDLRALLAALTTASFSKATPAPKVTTFKKLFAELLHFDLHPATTHEELRVLCEHLGLHALDDDSFNDLFHRLLIDHIEPKFSAMGPLIVRDFPPSQAALARLTPEGWADRFEFYWNGLEIANAFNEVTDPEEQIRRWQSEKDERAHLGTSEVPDDPDLIEALRRGLPPTGGIALGVERLYMACKGVREIRELKLFSTDELF
jgi:elongation factor P--(R)-beta-lysine ligase